MAPAVAGGSALVRGLPGEVKSLVLVVIVGGGYGVLIGSGVSRQGGIHQSGPAVLGRESSESGSRPDRSSSKFPDTEGSG